MTIHNFAPFLQQHKSLEKLIVVFDAPPFRLKLGFSLELEYTLPAFGPTVPVSPVLKARATVFMVDNI